MEIILYVIIICSIILCIVECIRNKLNPTPRIKNKTNEERIVWNNIVKTRCMYEVKKK